jgi:putative transposase
MAIDSNGNYIKGTKKDLPEGWFTYGYKYEIFPIEKHIQKLEKSFGCERKVYNEYVADFYDFLEKNNFNGGLIKYKIPSYTNITSRYDFLDKTNDSFVYNDAKIRFQNAIKKYNEEYAKKPLQYKKSARKKQKTIGYTPTIRDIKGLPKFHTKKQGKFSYTTNQTNGNIKITQTNGEFYLCIPKFQEGIKIEMHRELPVHGIIKKATIKREGSKYLVSLSVDFPMEKETLKTNISEEKIIGLDYSQKDLYVDSKGITAKYPRFHKIIEKRQKRLNKSLARKRERAEKDENENIIYSKRYQKTLDKYQKTMAKAKNQRKDFLHKRSNQITNDYDAVVVEDLNLNNLAQCLSLGKKLHDNGFGMYRDMLKYKADKKGKHYIVADKYFASTKICSECGHKKQSMKLSERVYKCENCHTKIDRDYNSGRNLKNYGKNTLKSMGVQIQILVLV